MKSLEDLSDSLNPLLVKEVRQLFHSKQYLVLMALFLLGTGRVAHAPGV